jgi:hypothetical protein
MCFYSFAVLNEIDITMLRCSDTSEGVAGSVALAVQVYGVICWQVQAKAWQGL